MSKKLFFGAISLIFLFSIVIIGTPVAQANSIENNENYENNLTVVKTAKPSGAVKQGGIITYTITVTGELNNEGSVAVLADGWEFNPEDIDNNVATYVGGSATGSPEILDPEHNFIGWRIENLPMTVSFQLQTPRK